MVAGATMALILALGVGAQDVSEAGRPGSGPRIGASRAGVSTDLGAGAPDTVRVRRRAVRLSEAYYTRQKIHKYSSFAMLPLFAFEYAAGDQLIKKSSSAPAWATNGHGIVAGAIGGLFAVNTLTGSLNWWESRKQSNGLAWRTTHAALMLLADAGFVATGALADEAEGNVDTRRLHRAVAVTSISMATVSYLMMLKPLRRD